MFDRKKRSSGVRRAGKSRGSLRARGAERDDTDDGYDDAEETGDEEPRSDRARGSRGETRRGRPRYDWDSGDDREPEDEPEDDRRDSYEEPPHVRQQRAKRRKLSLLDLCTPLFGCAAVLPREDGGVHPVYATFRQQVILGLQRLEKEAPENDIAREDAREAAYLMACFLDEQVASSQWTGKGQWAAEPLGITLHQDPDGGVNFFRRLEALDDRQRVVKEVGLVCIAFGFCGKYVEFNPAQRTAQLGEIRQRILRDLHATPMEQLRRLFPDAYKPASPVESDGPPAPRWWLYASIAVLVVVVIGWVVLYALAGPPRGAVDRVIESAGVLVRTFQELA